LIRAAAAFALVLGVVAPGAAGAQAPGGDAARGVSVFQDRCSACHVLGGVGQGPDLVGVVGRKAAHLAGFNYSLALQACGLVWTTATLDRFLSGPRKLVPGGAMRATISDAGERRDLIAYLASLKAGAR
jgi:cytochrome c2